MMPSLSILFSLMMFPCVCLLATSLVVSYFEKKY